MCCIRVSVNCVLLIMDYVKPEARPRRRVRLRWNHASAAEAGSGKSEKNRGRFAPRQSAAHAMPDSFALASVSQSCQHCSARAKSYQLIPTSISPAPRERRFPNAQLCSGNQKIAPAKILKYPVCAVFFPYIISRGLRFLIRKSCCPRREAHRACRSDASALRH